MSVILDRKPGSACIFLLSAERIAGRENSPLKKFTMFPQAAYLQWSGMISHALSRNLWNNSSYYFYFLQGIFLQIMD